MRSRSTRTSITAAVAIGLAISLTPGAMAAGHVETVVAFDPTAGQLSEGVAVANGDVYASLSPLGQLVKLAAGATEVETVAVLDGLAEGDFGLIGLTIHDDGDIYGAVFSADPDLTGVWRFDAETGAAERVPGTEAIPLPNDVAFGEDGTMYVSDTVGGAVWRVPSGGTAEAWVSDELLQGTGEAGFPFPLGANGIDVQDGHVYVGVTETAQVVIIPIGADGSAGAPETLTQYEAAVDGVALDAAGNVYATHPLDNLVTKRTPDGEVSVIATVDDGLDAPSSVEIATDADGNTVAYIANFSIAMGGPLGAGPSILSLEVE